MPELAAAAPPAGQPEESMPAMSFLEHLEELRRRIIYAIIAVAVGFFACWGYAERIYSIIQKPLIAVNEYTDLFLTVILGLGVVFELPILVFFLSLMGVISAGWMWRNVRYSILVIFIIAAILTPTTDILNMCVFAAPMVALYLVSIGIAWLVHPKQRRARQARKAQ